MATKPTDISGKKKKTKKTTIATPAKKKLRAQQPDVIVAVGEGEDRREFPCYRIVLSFASPYLDAMLSHPMRESNDCRIDFPDKDPDEWNAFYSFVDPSSNRHAQITTENVQMLLPWFHEFQMEGMLRECDIMTSGIVLKHCCWSDISTSKRTDDTCNKVSEGEKVCIALFGFLEASERYDLFLTRKNTLRELSWAMRFKHELFDVDAFQRLIPYIKEGRHDRDTQKFIKAILPSDLHGMLDDDRWEELCSNKLLPHLLHAECARQTAAARSGSAKEALKKVLDLPPRLFHALPHTRSVGRESLTLKVNELAESRLRKIIQFDFMFFRDVIGIPLKADDWPDV